MTDTIDVIWLLCMIALAICVAFGMHVLPHLRYVLYPLAAALGALPSYALIMIEPQYWWVGAMGLVGTVVLLDPWNPEACVAWRPVMHICNRQWRITYPLTMVLGILPSCAVIVREPQYWWVGVMGMVIVGLLLWIWNPASKQPPAYHELPSEEDEVF